MRRLQPPHLHLDHWTSAHRPLATAIAGRRWPSPVAERHAPPACRDGCACAVPLCVDMERFFKRTRSSGSSSSNEPNVIEQVENQSRVELNLDDIVSDPGLRKPIEEFDITIRDQARREYALRGPCQPNGHVYPKTTFENVDNAFIKDGYNNWKRALERFNRHMGTVNSCHNEARIQFEAFQDQRHSVGNILRVHSRDMEIDYRTRLTAMLDVTRFLLKQGLPFRGHDESTSSSNREITLAIINDIGDKFFSLMVDEARDSSVKEHMGVVLRYVNKKGCVIERFLAVVHVPDTSSHSLKMAIDALFVQHGLSLSRLRGQGYDGASNMRGEFNGLKSLILQENPFAMYVHCFSHQLQLVLVVVAHDNFTVSEFFGYITMIVNISGASCKRRDQLRKIQHDKIIAELESGEITSGKGKNQETSLARPGDTRWGSHYLTLLRLCSMWSSVIEVLGNVYDDASYSANKGVAAGLIEKMESYQFVFVLHLMKYILGITNELSLSLQQGDQNIVQAMSLVRSVKCRLQDFREDGWQIILEQVNTFCELNMIPILDMEDNMLTRGHGRRRGQLITNFHHYRVEIFCQVVDLIIQEMNNRFTEVSTELLGCISCLHPRNSFSQFDVHKLIHLADFYPEDFCGTDYLFLEQQLMSYFYNLRDDPYFSSIDDLGILAQKLVETEKHLVFPLVYRMIELALVLPVATASVERVFSAMKTVKTDLRNRMGDEWMNDSLVVYIEKDIFSTIENEQILQHFQQMQSRRIQLPPLVPTRQSSQTSVMENRSSIKWDKGKALEF
ncbi:zinc finger MYM-type protein 1-like [Zingiber officinale]|uniref:zinc finger MYM-type protein 1-like n=1 Tax=Zingiber officinale TaxID=94328 RepID=UPI001C4B29F6|nr:zinc finger MYM-type protein 1-like [Zingiber officinale]